jgi:succinyl-diaminopimelate desuccinylase
MSEGETMTAADVQTSHPGTGYPALPPEAGHPALPPEAGHPALRPAALAASLARLVAVPSVNPGISEQAMLDAVMRELAGLDLETTVVEFAPGRPSLAAVLTGSGDGPTLVLNGHIDTVPVGDRALWSGDPFGGEVRDAAVWGRGSLDMKGGLVAQIACAHALAADRARMRGRLVLPSAAGEECGEPGTRSLLERGFGGDFGIVTEPTDLAVATAMRGVCWHTIRIVGAATHAGTAEAGRNPTAALPRLIAAIEAHDAQLRTRTHPRLASGAATVTEVRAGVEHNAVPDVCEVVVDRRMLPGESPEAVRDELAELTAEALGEAPDLDWSIEPLHRPFTPVEISPDADRVRALVRIAEAATGRPVPIVGTPYGSDVRNLVHDAGMDAVTFGAGDVRGCHCPNEHLPVAELSLAATIITAFASEMLLAS